jgi:hypothetical protein
MLESVVELGISVIFSLCFYGVLAALWSPWLYFYFLFSYFWVTLTIQYVVYMAVSGVFATWYFLNETEYYPESPVAASFKRACTTSFGSAALGGFLLAVVQTLEALVQSSASSTDSVAMLVVRCCALCLLAIVKCFVQLVTRYALIYCATFGVPFVEGCRRYLELMCTRYAELLLGHLIINFTLGFNQIIFAIITAFAAFGVSYAAFHTDYGTAYYILAVISCVCAALFSFATFSVLSEPTVTGCDTLIVCYLEAPDRLLSSAKDLAERLNLDYAETLAKILEAEEARKKPT